jgi:predicted GIY-YIG superfamily endonuclease
VQYPCAAFFRAPTTELRPLFTVYILRSETTGRHYCGQTDDLDRRLRQHNDSEYHGSRTTKRFEGPWTLLWSEPHGVL